MKRSCNTLDQRKDIDSNFIIIVNEDEIDEAVKECSESIPQGRRLVIIKDFNDVHDTLNRIQSLKESNFVLFTTKEGGIGVDFKGSERAHVIIAFKYSTGAEIT